MEDSKIVEFPLDERVSDRSEQDQRAADSNETPEGGSEVRGPDSEEVPEAIEELDEAEVVERFTGYVYSITDEIWNRRRCDGLTRDDLHSYAFGGLIEAFRNYDSDRQAEFTTYAYLRIRGAVIDALRQVQWAPRSRKGQRRDDVGSTRANESSRSFREAARDVPFDASAAELPADEPMFTYLMAPTEMQQLEFGQEADQVRRVELEQKMQVLREAMDQLSEFERTIVRLYDLEGRTMPEIADELGCSKSWVTRVRDRALDEMRDHVDARSEGAPEERESRAGRVAA